jgi:hypothetical protein
MRKEARKQSSGDCAVLSDPEGFAIVLKYYGIEGSASPRPAESVTPAEAAPAPVQEAAAPAPPVQEAKKSVSFDVNLDDLL